MERQDGERHLLQVALEGDEDARWQQAVAALDAAGVTAVDGASLDLSLWGEEHLTS